MTNPTPSPFATVLFDVDGTLIDSNAAHTDTWMAALDEHGFRVGRDELRHLIGMGGDKLLRKVANVDDRSPLGRAISGRKAQLFGQRLPALRPTRGARSLVESLHRAGVTLGVATSSSQKEMTALLTQAGVNEFFQAHVTKDDVAETKPDPDIVSRALADLEADPGAAVLIGDTPYDIEAAHRAGVECIALRCGGGWTDADLSDARARFDDPAELLESWPTLMASGRDAHPEPADTDADALVSHGSDTTADEETEASARRARPHRPARS